MKIKLLILGFLFLLGFAGGFYLSSKPPALKQQLLGSDATQTLLNQWVASSTVQRLVPRNLNNGVLIPTSSPLQLSALNCTGYTNNGVLTTDASGFVICDDDDGGAGGGSSSTPAGLTNSLQYKVNSSTFGGTNFFQGTSGVALGINSTTPSAIFVAQGTSTQPTMDILRVASSTNTVYLQVTSAGITLPRNLDSIRIASTFPGSDCGAKIVAARADLGLTTPGEIWVSQGCGTTISTAVTLNGNQVLRFTQGGTYTVSAAITIGHLVGSGYGNPHTTTNTAPTILKQANTTNLAAMIIATTTGASIRDIAIDGNKANNATAKDCVLINKKWTTFEDVQVSDCKRHGFAAISATDSGNEAQAPKFFGVTSVQNGSAGFYIENATDPVFEKLTEAENNGTYGIHLHNAGAARIIGSDIAWNVNCGLYATGSSTGFSSGLLLINGNQFGLNYSHDICIDGRYQGEANSSYGSQITGNEFYGGDNRTDDVTDAIILSQSYKNTITGNTFISITGHDYRYGVNASTSVSDVISSNVFTGTFTTTALTSSTTQACLNSNSDVGCTITASTTVPSLLTGTSAGGLSIGATAVSGSDFHTIISRGTNEDITFRTQGSGTMVLAADTTLLLNQAGSLVFGTFTGQKLGIATQTPAQALSVVGSTSITSLMLANCDVKALAASGELYCGTDANSGGGDSAWTLGSGLIYNATSTDEIGIGTSTPAYTLDIQGNGTTKLFNIASATGAQLLTLHNTGTLVVGATPPTTANGPFASGVGLGNFVSSCTNCGAAAGNLIGIANYGGGSAGINTFSARGTPAAPTVSLSGDVLYFMGARGHGTSTWAAGSKAAIQMITGANWTDADQSTYMTFETTNASSTTRVERMRITPDGSVGIGTTSPIATLAVQGTSTLPVLPVFVAASSTGTSLLTVAANGKIGIGTSTPGALLTFPSGGTAATQGINLGDAASVIYRSGAATLNIGSGLSTLNLGSTFVTFNGGTNLTSSSLLASAAYTLSGAVTALNSGTNFSIQTGGSNTLTSGTVRVVNISNNTFAPTSGTGVSHILEIQGTTNQTSSASGVSRGIFINPINTSAFDYRMFESSSTLITTLSTNTTISTAYQMLLNPQTIATASSAAYTLANASTLSLANPIAGLGVVISSSTAISITSSTLNASTTNAYGLYLQASTGATNNYAAALLGGNVGIGTATPGSTLTIQGTGAAIPLHIASSTGASLLTVLPSGRVGIGTSTPEALLHLVDSSSTTQPAILRIGGTTTPTTAKLGCLALYDKTAALYVYMKFAGGTFTTSTSESICQ